MILIRRFILLSLLIISVSIHSLGAEIYKIEPPSWWVGMNNTQLQLMLYGKNLKGSRVFTSEKGINILSVENADSPNYLFINIKLSPRLKPGVYKFNVVNINGSHEFDYLISSKGNSGSLTGKGFGPEDMIYLLMPDRFINGDISNDNHPVAAEKADYLNPYGRHGGDIKGMINSLDYLSELGVTKIWSTPLLFDNEPSASYHGYACADYYKIDPRFGDNNLFVEYVKEAANREIGIIMDMVPNHSGKAHWWMNDFPFKNWVHTFPEYTQSNYAMSTHSDIHSASVDNERCTTGWFDTSMPDMNLSNPYLLKYFIQNAIWWIESAGLAGIRVDTYPYSDKYAIAEWTKAIMNEYPKMNIVGECWFQSPQEIAYWEGEAINRDGYSSHLTNVMDFPLQEALGWALNSDGNPDWGEGLFRIYKTLSLDYIFSNPNKLLIFADNHDTNRISEILKGDKNKFRNMVNLLATIRGIPQLYYGTEIMMKTSDGKLGHGEERMDMIKREAFTLEQEENYRYLSSLFTWRKSSNAVAKGDMKHYWPSNNLYIFVRTYKDEKVMVVVNNNTKQIELDWDRIKESIDKNEIGVDIFTKRKMVSGDNITIEPQSSIIIEFRK